MSRAYWMIAGLVIVFVLLRYAPRIGAGVLILLVAMLLLTYLPNVR